MAKKINFRGVDIVITENNDIAIIKCRKKYKFSYGLRHADNDLSVPITVEKAVLMNRWGYLFSNDELEFPEGKGAFLILTEEEKMLFENMEE